MRIRSTWMNATWMAVLCFSAPAQTPPPQEAPAAAKEANENKRLPPRAAPTDYQAHAKAGNVTIAADFQAHAVPTPDATFNDDDYVVVEVALYGPPNARLKLSIEDFTLRINDKKTPLTSRPYGMVLSSLKDPSWSPPDTGESKSKTGINTGGTQDSTPVVVHMPFPLQRAMEQKVQKAALPEGDRALPEAGLIFFSYHGKEKGVHSVELTYAGPAGKVILRLTP